MTEKIAIDIVSIGLDWERHLCGFKINWEMGIILNGFELFCSRLRGECEKSVGSIFQVTCIKRYIN